MSFEDVPDEPALPDGWPAYLVDPLRRQDPERLRAVADYAAELARHKEAREAAIQAAIDERLATDEAVQDVRPTDEGYAVVKEQRCGKDGCRCADGNLHGPYKWHVTPRPGGDGYDWRSLGPVESA
jgi:hypothetical protein